MRIWAYVVATVIALSMPFIHMGESAGHVFLLSFESKQLHLVGVIYDMQELYVMPFVVMFLFIFIFFITVLGGRVWCGWACPQTIFRVIYRDFIETTLLGMRKKVSNKQKDPDMSLSTNKIKKVVAVLLWTVFAVVAASDFVLFFVSSEVFFDHLVDWENHKVMIGFIAGVAGFLIYDIVWMKEDFCIYICPYSRIQSVLYDDDTIMAVYSNKRGGQIYKETEDGDKHKIIDKQSQLPEGAECITCQKCVSVCPTHIDIRAGLQLECINCLECVDACTIVQSKFDRPSLISWTSVKEAEKEGKTKFFRSKILMYIVLLIGIVGMMFKMGSTKENMLLNINRTTQLYSIKKNNIVDNNYIFLIKNTQDQDHKFYFEVEGSDDIKILRPKKPFKVKAGKMVKKVVVLRTEKKLANDSKKDTPIHVIIKAFAVDDEEKIIVHRNTVFFYPRADQFNK
jgi:cytochrome c oxidase accessory protein FixG